MKLAQIIQIASSRLQDDVEDIGDFYELFKAYANEGYREIVSDYIKPRTTKTCYTDCKGLITTRLRDVKTVLTASDERGKDIPFEITGDGRSIRTGIKNGCVRLLCEITYPDMLEGEDEPDIPESIHTAICDYICFRQLSGGNLAQQRRSQMWYQNFQRQANTVNPQGYRACTQFRNLYTSTDIRHSY